MIKTRAIYIGDVRFNNCPVFELKENGYFEMIEDVMFKYEKEIVEKDDDWILFEVDCKKEKAKLVNR